MKQSRTYSLTQEIADAFDALAVVKGTTRNALLEHVMTEYLKQQQKATESMIECADCGKSYPKRYGDCPYCEEIIREKMREKQLLEERKFLAEKQAFQEKYNKTQAEYQEWLVRYRNNQTTPEEREFWIKKINEIEQEAKKYGGNATIPEKTRV